MDEDLKPWQSFIMMLVQLCFLVSLIVIPIREYGQQLEKKKREKEQRDRDTFTTLDDPETVEFDTIPWKI